MSASFHDVAIDTERMAWLERRRRGIGASEVAGILGLSPWSSPWAIFADKCGLLPIEDRDSEPMEFGRRAEPMLKQWFEDRTGFTVTGTQREAEHPEHPWAIATLDGEVLDDAGALLGIAEWKATSEPEWVAVPDMYACQAQWGMFVTGTERCWFGVLHAAFGRPRFRIYEFARDQSDIDFIVARCSAFWHDRVLTGVPPDVDGSDATTEAICAVWPEQVPTSVTHADADALATLALIRHDEAEAKRLDRQITERKNYLRAVLAETETLIDPTDLDAKGNPRKLASFKTQSATRIDSAALKARMPRVAARFSTTTSSRVLRLSPTKEA